MFEKGVGEKKSYFYSLSFVLSIDAMAKVQKVFEPNATWNDKILLNMNQRLLISCSPCLIRLLSHPHSLS